MSTTYKQVIDFVYCSDWKNIKSAKRKPFYYFAVIGNTPNDANGT